MAGQFKQLHVFDFDGTLFKSPVKPDNWSGAWWTDPKSLDPPCVAQDPSKGWWNAPIVERAAKSIASPSVRAVVMTGRVDKKFRKRVEALLAQAGLSGFDRIYMNPGMNTRKFKQLFTKRILNKYRSITTVQVWDDKDENAQSFQDPCDEFGVKLVWHSLPTRANRAGCSGDSFTEAIARGRVRRIINENVRPLNAPYPVNHAGTSLGWGTGMGGFNMFQTPAGPHMGGYPNKLGADRLRSNPVEPYSSEFSDEEFRQRKQLFDASLRRFQMSMDELKRDVSTANNPKAIDELLDQISNDDDDIAGQIIADLGTFQSALKAGNVQKAQMMLVRGIDGWARDVASECAKDLDYDILDRYVYSKPDWMKRGGGPGRFS